MFLEKIMIWLTLKQTGTGGHVAVMDAIDYKCDKWDKYYAYVKPSSENDPDPNPQPGPDTEEGSDYAALVAKYGKIYTESYASTNCKIKFNWGWNSKDDDDVVVDFNFLNVTVHKEEINEATYCPYKIITYTIN